MLPEAFTDRMEQMLKEEYPSFLQSYQEMEIKALRLNVLKADRERFLGLSPFSLSPVPWEKNGFYYGEKDRPGKHPYHEAGVYYIQEASAMAPAAFLSAKPGEKVLDLCAAPGGKSTQIAADMQGEGIFICNEMHPARAKILSENIERMGIDNAIVTNHSPKELSYHFQEYFDRILVDAPCSGEGMFRKNEEACKEWTRETVRMCAVRQGEILDYAAKMLKAGGRLVYSTCTFAPEENEGSICRFLKRHPEFTVCAVEMTEGMSKGRADWIEGEAPGVETENAEHVPAESLDDRIVRIEPLIERTVRLWPHKLKGEGHFAAVLEKEGVTAGEAARGKFSKSHFQAGLKEREYAEYRSFEKEHLKTNKQGVFVQFGEQLYLLPKEAPSLDKLKVLRPGLHLGTMKKKRFEPAHALALSLKQEAVYRKVNLAASDERVLRYLQGETFETEAEGGWNLICADGYSLGFGKAVNGIMKNHYPKGLRKNLM